MEAAQGIPLRNFRLFELYKNPFGLPLGRLPADNRFDYFRYSPGALRGREAISASAPRLELCYITL